MVHYELPCLSYKYHELEPYIDEQTMRIHHQKHHKSYTDGLNKILAELSATSHPEYITSILSNVDSIPEHARKSLNFFGGGFENHKIFWESITPNGDNYPGGKLADAIDVYFNNFENFKKLFSSLACTINGSGWCWLVFNQTYNKIEIITTENQDSPWIVRKIPLLCIDVWEHAYYLQYQNNRSNYIESWWNLVNWNYVENKFSQCV